MTEKNKKDRKKVSQIDASVVTQRHTDAERFNLKQKLLRRLSHRSVIGYYFVGPAILFFLFVSIFPLTRTIVTSLTDKDEGVLKFVGIQHYLELLQDEWFWNSLFNIGIFTGSSLILHISIGLGLALLINETWFSNTLRNFFRGLLILPWIFSTATAGLMWSLLYHPFGIINYIAVGILGFSAPLEFLQTPSTAMASVVVVNTWKSYPFYMIIILGGLQVIPQELYEAAKVDGANAWHRFIYITLPQLRSLLIATSIIDIITTAGHVDLIRILTRGGPFRSTETVAYYIYNKAILDGNMGYGAAISTLMLIILSILIIIYLKIISRGGGTGETTF
mgnify:FL=1|jgi:multiple sugar transport system permease protein|tara:strand:+ start:142 stop:1146 length:1005 start_codon:yes stop_codon:yes gene_type:complete